MNFPFQWTNPNRDRSLFTIPCNRRYRSINVYVTPLKWNIAWCIPLYLSAYKLYISYLMPTINMVHKIKYVKRLYVYLIYHIQSFGSPTIKYKCSSMTLIRKHQMQNSLSIPKRTLKIKSFAWLIPSLMIQECLNWDYIYIWKSNSVKHSNVDHQNLILTRRSYLDLKYNFV